MGTVVTTKAKTKMLDAEAHRQVIDGYTVISDTKIRYACTLAAGTLDDEYISEIGLYDAEGDFIAFKSFLKKGKDADVEVVFECDDTF